MPIIVDRKTGAIQAPQYTQEQKDRAWEAIVRAQATEMKKEDTYGKDGKIR